MRKYKVQANGHSFQVLRAIDSMKAIEMYCRIHSHLLPTDVTWQPIEKKKKPKKLKFKGTINFNKDVNY